MASGTSEIKDIEAIILDSVLANSCMPDFLFPLFILDNSWRGKQNGSHRASNWLEHHLTILQSE